MPCKVFPTRLSFIAEDIAFAAKMIDDFQDEIERLEASVKTLSEFPETHKWKTIAADRLAEIERLQRYPDAIARVREEEKPGVIVGDWHVVCRVLNRIEELVKEAAEAKEKANTLNPRRVT